MDDYGFGARVRESAGGRLISWQELLDRWHPNTVAFSYRQTHAKACQGVRAATAGPARHFLDENSPFDQN